MAKKIVEVIFGSHSSVNVIFEDQHEVETKVTIESTNKDGSHFVMISDNKDEFVEDLSKLLRKFYI